MAPYIRAARGNADEIGAFLLSQGEADMPYALKMLQSLSEKDMLRYRCSNAYVSYEARAAE